jgi:hypothetical protein
LRILVITNAELQHSGPPRVAEVGELGDAVPHQDVAAAGDGCAASSVGECDRSHDCKRLNFVDPTKSGVWPSNTIAGASARAPERTTSGAG